jgi:hypothetical protein
MHWRPTWILLGTAAALFAFIVLFERRLPDRHAPPPRLFAFRAAEVTNVQVRLTNQLILNVARPATGGLWSLSFPVAYLAQTHAVEWLVQSLAEVVPHTEISPQELKAGQRTIAEFGLDVPQATLTLHHNGQRTEVMFGTQTPVGDGVYAQVLNQSPIYVLNAELVERLPRTYHDWRDTALFSSVGFQLDRMEVRAGGRGFTVDFDRATRSFLLTKPIVARADTAKVEAFLRKLLTAQVVQFVTDSPRADLEAYGLQPPEAEVAFLVGSNEQYSVKFAVQFGKSPTNDPASVYARRPATTNIVLVPRAVLEAAQVSQSDVRDLHLVNFSPDAVELIEVVDAAESFTLRRLTNGNWMVTEPKTEPADADAVREFFDLLSRLEGVVERDVVTDFATPYGLNPPARRYWLKTSLTNATGLVTNPVLAELDLGREQDKRVFARRPDEATVYSLSKTEELRLPRAAWQLRDRRVWNFATNQVHRLALRHQGQTKTLQRNANATWSLAEGAGVVSTVNPALEDAVLRLGELRANAWVDRGQTNRAAYGFTEHSTRITVELKNGEKPQSLVLEIGRPGVSPTGLPFGLAVVDGQTWIFEMPPAFYFEVLVRDLLNSWFPPSP